MKTRGRLRPLAAALALLMALGTAGCTRYEGEAGESEKDGVTMRTEQAVYPPDVEEIRVLWKNDSGAELTFGEGWGLERQDGDTWKEVSDKEGGTFHTIGYGVGSRMVREHTYRVSDYADRLEEGTYRILTTCLEGQGESLKTHSLTAAFEVKA